MPIYVFNSNSSKLSQLDSTKRDRINENRNKRGNKDLKKIITNQKINNIKDMFIEKLKRNNIYSKPI